MSEEMPLLNTFFCIYVGALFLVFRVPFGTAVGTTLHFVVSNCEQVVGAIVGLVFSFNSALYLMTFLGTLVSENQLNYEFCASN